jgi:hypothetical protein
VSGGAAAEAGIAYKRLEPRAAGGAAAHSSVLPLKGDQGAGLTGGAQVAVGTDC